MAGDYEILGIDFHSDVLYLVQLEKHRDKLVWSNSAQVEYDSHAGVNQIADCITKAIDEFGFTARHAVFNLFPDSGFLKFSDTREDAPDRNEGGVVEDSWRGLSGKLIRGFAPYNEVIRLSQIASLAKIKLQSVELRSLAALTSMGVFDQPADAITRLLLSVDSRVITLGLVRGGELQAVQTQNRDQTSSTQDALKSVTSMIRLMELSGFSLASGAVVQANVCDPALAEQLKGKLQIDIENFAPGEVAGIEISSQTPESSADYTAALGSALEGIKQSLKIEPQTGLNFLKACYSLKKPKKLEPRKVMTAVGIVFVVMIIISIGSVISKQLRRNRLQEYYTGLEPRREAYLKATDLQRSLKNWLPLGSGGQRTAYRPIFDTITELFPSTDQAYVTSLEIKHDPEKKTVIIRMDGRSRSSEVLFEFISRLNNSMKFDKATLGKVTDLADATSPYIKKFSLTFAIRQKNDV